MIPLLDLGKKNMPLIKQISFEVCFTQPQCSAIKHNFFFVNCDFYLLRSKKKKPGEHPLCVVTTFLTGSVAEI